MRELEGDLKESLEMKRKEGKKRFWGKAGIGTQKGGRKALKRFRL